MKALKSYLEKHTPVDLGWSVKRWFPVDIDKLRQWYTELETRFQHCKFVYENHKYMWRDDPGDSEGIIGHKFMPDTAWYTLCWSKDIDGPLPPERGQALPEYQDYDDDSLCPRRCFFGYALEIVQSIPFKTKRWIVSIHTPGTRLITHQDSPEKIRVHIPIYTNNDSNWIIADEQYHLEPGWAYLINTTLPHSVENTGNTNRIHLYGKIWTEDILNVGHA